MARLAALVARDLGLLVVAIVRSLSFPSTTVARLVALAVCAFTITLSCTFSVPLRLATTLRNTSENKTR